MTCAQCDYLTMPQLSLPGTSKLVPVERISLMPVGLRGLRRGDQEKCEMTTTGYIACRASEIVKNCWAQFKKILLKQQITYSIDL